MPSFKCPETMETFASGHFQFMACPGIQMNHQFIHPLQENLIQLISSA